MSCDHKFKSSLDGLNVAETDGKLHFATVIFCEKCGAIAYNGNWSDIHRKEDLARLKENSKQEKLLGK